MAVIEAKSPRGLSGHGVVRFSSLDDLELPDPNLESAGDAGARASCRTPVTTTDASWEMHDLDQERLAQSPLTPHTE
jgi:hypothetical protein